jgi:hypothetical protein
MKLITETNLDGINMIAEAKDDGSKDYYIEGIFMQSETKNKNGRVYPKDILMNEVSRYANEYVGNKRALGELGHPEGPTVNLERVSHLITELRQEGNDILGKAKIMDTPYGKIVKNLIDEGAKIGVSSRGMGSLKKNKNGINEVQNDFMLSAVDIVADPSAPSAFVNGIMEGKEWIWDNGIIKSQDVKSYETLINSASSKADLEEKALYAFVDFLSKL